MGKLPNCLLWWYLLIAICWSVPELPWWKPRKVISSWYSFTLNREHERLGTSQNVRRIKRIQLKICLPQFSKASRYNASQQHHHIPKIFFQRNKGHLEETLEMLYVMPKTNKNINLPNHSLSKRVKLKWRQQATESLRGRKDIPEI